MKKPLFFIMLLFTGLLCHAGDFHTILKAEDNLIHSEISLDIRFREETLIIKAIEKSKNVIDWTITEITEEEANELFGYIYNDFQDKAEYVIDSDQMTAYAIGLGIFNAVVAPLLDEEGKLNIAYKELIEWGKNIENPFNF